MKFKNSVIPEDKIEENKRRFLELYESLIENNFVGASDLKEWILGTDFFYAPASTMYHMSCIGGLCQHSLNVYDRLVSLLKSEYGEQYEEAVGVNASEVAVIGLLHDICKADTYVVEMRNVKDESGNWKKEPFYRYNPKFEFGHGEKSVFIIQNFIRGLSLNVCSAIRYHMGASGNPNSSIKDDAALKSMEVFPIILFTCMADSLATYIDEKREEIL